MIASLERPEELRTVLFDDDSSTLKSVAVEGPAMTDDAGAPGPTGDDDEAPGPTSDGDEAPGPTSDGDEAPGPTRADPVTAEADGITARYYETASERVLAFEREGRAAAIAQNVEGYAMLKVRPAADGDELERYYGFDMALDHAAELLGVAPHDLPVPEPADDMGM